MSDGIERHCLIIPDLGGSCRGMLGWCWMIVRWEWESLTYDCGCYDSINYSHDSLSMDLDQTNHKNGIEFPG